VANEEPEPFAPSTGFGRVESLYATFRAARIEPDSVLSRDAWGADRQWLREKRQRDERWGMRRAQILTGAAVALFTAALSVAGPWLFRLLTGGGP
jgi:hypothetical protein